MAYTVETLIRKRIKNGGSVITQGNDIIETSKKSTLTDCRKYLHEFNDEFRHLGHQEKQERRKAKIYEYVMNVRPLTAGFLTEDKQLDTQALMEWLINEITDRGILTTALNDPTVNEIRINERDIWLEKLGRFVPYTDINGDRIRFDSPTQQQTLFNKLLGDNVRLSGTHQLVSASTDEGYRVAAIHETAIGTDPLRPYTERYGSIVLRKFQTHKFELPEIVLHGTISDSMAKFFTMFTRGGIPWVTVGPTASGKTTTNNAILIKMPYNKRLVILQNPSEIDGRQRDLAGNVINDVVHLEANDVDDGNMDAEKATMENLLNQLLRISPYMVCVGELRTNGEFKRGMKVALAGHPLNCTYHAEDARIAISRYLTAYLAESPNEPPHIALESLTQALKIIIVQRIMEDGTRRVLQVTEVLGVDPENPNEPILKDIFRFVQEDESDVDENGNVLKIYGSHKRVGAISPYLIDKLKLMGVPRSQYDFLTKEPELDKNGSYIENETYTGKIDFDFVNKRYIAA
ncbi:hypothetical protein AGMMS49975_17350 [Clostridia bacterium]|nr:hypothetical protein AGMMS49975_17350 [Clostridia bacterium]